MLSVNIVDMLLDKLFSFPTKRKETSLVKFTGSQSLLSNVNNDYNLSSEYYNDFSVSDWIVPENFALKTTNINSVISHSFNQILRNGFNRRINKLSFSPFVSSLLQDLDHPDSFDFSSYLNKNNLLDEMLLNLIACKDNQMPKYSDTVKTIQRDITIPDPKSSTEMTRKPHISMPNLVLSQELANRKAKELQKRSKKRRRRQKKAHVSECKLDSAILQNSCIAVECDKIKSRSVSLSNFNKTDFENHKSQNSGFCDKFQNSNNSDHVENDFVLLAVESSPDVVQIVLPNASAIFISLEDTSDEDSGWDVCDDSDHMPEASEFEFSGLFITNLSASRTTPVCSSTVSIISCASNEDLEDIKKYEDNLLEVNKNWNEATKEVDRKPRMPLKVSFAPDSELTEVIPVEICERKGEWEIYALERIRFKKRIDELEKILSPCFSKAHRTKIFQQLHLSNL